MLNDFVYVIAHGFPNYFIMTTQIPKSDATSSADEVEVFMYKHMFEYLQCYAERTSRKKNEIQMPIPIGINIKCIKKNDAEYSYNKILYIMIESINVQDFLQCSMPIIRKTLKVATS